MGTRTWKDTAYAAKAWVGSVVAAVGAAVLTIEAVTADKAITLDEANGVVMAITAVVTVLATFGSIFHTENKP